jgi:uncharacterized protein (UPF0332 family)
MKAIRFLDTADKLKDSYHEADARTSISRSYYAIIHLVKEKLGQEEIEIDRGQTHNLHNFFFNCKSVDVKAIGKNISTLQHERIKADYKLSEKVKKTHARINYRLACKTKEDITSLFEGDDKEDIVKQARMFCGAGPN